MMLTRTTKIYNITKARCRDYEATNTRNQQLLHFNILSLPLRGNKSNSEARSWRVAACNALEILTINSSFQ